MTRVLIAEDETIIRLDLRGLLESNGFEVCGEARDGVEAVELATTLEPDVILMDIKMPRLDGIEAARTHPRKASRSDRDADRVRPGGARRASGRGRRLRLPRQAVPRAGRGPGARRGHGATRRVRRGEAPGEIAAEALEARKAIERAKGILMAKEGISEEEAFARLRRASQRSGRPMKVIADAVAATLG